MCKKSLLMMLLLALLVPWTAKAQSTVTIGDGTGTDRVMPFNSWYGYSFSEIIYPAADLVADGTIHSISFYNTSGTEQTNDIVLYMKNVTRSTFDSNTDYEAVTTSDIVFQGQWTIPATEGWSTITLDTPFAFDGVSNLMIAIDENTAGYSSRYFTYTNVSNSGISFYSDSYNPDPYDLGSFSGSSSVRNQRSNMRVSITYTTVPCFAPTDLAASNITINSADLSWVEQGAATSWVLEYDTDPSFNSFDYSGPIGVGGIPSYPITGLTDGTTYYFRVKADCDSDWATSSFTTKQVALAVGNGWSDDFEGNLNWVLYTGGDNAWYISYNIDTTNVSNILYVSNDSGATNAYTMSAQSIVYATKLMTFENAQYTFDFDWKAFGESNYDYIRAFLIPDTCSIIPNQLPDIANNSPYQFSTLTPAGWIDFGGGKLNLQNTWQTANEAVNVTAGDYYVAFMWVNDYSAGTNPPAAIDNFSITKVTCPTPTNFVASDVTGHTAILSWEGLDAEAWQIAYTDDADAEPDDLTAIDVTETSYALTGLAAETHFYAYVRTVCGQDYTEWLSTDFTTLVACPAPTGLAVTLTFADGTVATLDWTENGTATDWDVEYGTDPEFGNFTVVNVAGTPSTQLTGLTPETTYYARVKTYCGGEDGYSTYSNIVTFTPTDALTLTVNDGTATNSYVPVYGLYVDEVSKSQFIIPAESISDLSNYVIDKLTFYSSTTSLSWGAAEFEVYFAEVDYTTFDAATVVNWASMTKVMSAASLSISDNQMVVELETPYLYNGGNLLIGVLETTSGTWKSCAWYGVSQSAYTAIGGYESSKALSPYQFLPKVTFDVSEVPSCFPPTRLEVADVTPFGATLSWKGNATQYNVQYRPVAHGEVYFSDGFEQGFNNWTLIDADGDGYNWKLGTTEGNFGSHSGSDCVVSQSCYTDDDGETWIPLTPDNYMVSPQVPLTGTITFWACGQDASYVAEHFGVAVSTTSNDDPDAFTTIREWTMTAKGTGAKTSTTRSGNRVQGTWYEFVVDLNAYEGDPGYVAIRHFGSTDMFYLDVDDVVIEGPTPSPYAWIDATATANSLNLTGLDPNTEYEWQVQAVCDVDDESTWTVGPIFTTGNTCAAPVELNSIPLVTSATLEWQEPYEGFQQASYIVHYREAAVGWEQVGSDETATGDWTQYSFDLSDYAGQQGYVALRHYHITDQYWLLVDDITYGGTTYNFDDGELPTGWTLYDLDDDGYNWEVFDLTFGDTTGTTNYAYSGNYGITSQSFINNIGALNPDNWIVLPYGDLGGTLTLYAKGLDADYAAEVFGVFVFTEEEISFENNNPWIEVSGITDLSYILEGLDPTTTYEWQVQGVNRDCEDGVTAWSETATFTTHDYCDAPDFESFELETLESNTATLTWVGYQDSYYVEYAVSTEYFWDDFSSETLDNWTYDNLYYPYVEDLTGSGLYGYPFVYDEETGVQTLISTEMRPTIEGTILQFYYASIGTSVFKVGYSSTDNNLASFTWGEEVTASAAQFTQYLDENVPAGTKYFAVQYISGEEDGFLGVTYFYVYDDIEVEWTELIVNEPSVTLDSLEPNTAYEVYVQGICGEGEEDVTDWVGLSFTTPEPSTVTQTVALSEGWNWWSTYIDGEDMLNQLKASLGTVGVSVKTQGASMIYRGGRWMGSVPMENGRGYQIMVNAPVELTMEGQIVDPSTCPITILPGANWIGYPLTESKTVAAALAGTGFTPTNGDAISTQGGSAMYRSGRWMPASFTLEPGKGYLYKSNATENGTIVFSNGKKLMSQGNQLTPKVKKDTVNAIEENVSIISKSNKNKVSFKIK